MISLVGLDKAEVLAALYNASRPLGMGFMHYDPTPMIKEEAQKLLEQRISFDYLKGRVMKVSLEGDAFDPWGYNRDNGKDAAEMAISAMQVNEPIVLEDMHKAGVKESIATVREHIHEETAAEKEDGCVVVRLGFADVTNKLAPAIDRAKQNANISQDELATTPQ